MNQNTTTTEAGAVGRDEAERIAIIQKTIKERGDALRTRYPVLGRQNLVGMAIFLIAVGGVLVSGWAYWQGLISAWLCIPLVAFFTSLLHELEHDLIHWQYFKKQKAVHNLMLLVIWALRPGTINPWIRRKLHFLHHKVSGTEQDMEERGIGNGQNFGPLRWFIMLDTYAGNLLKALIITPRGSKAKRVGRILMANFPFPLICATLWYGWLGYTLVNGVAAMAGVAVTWSADVVATMGWVQNLVVVLIAPFYLRSFCLNFISSNMHYYGDVGSLMQQTQVLNRWYFWPFQLFCFNFGSTHGIHHFVVGEPFYIRQLTAPVAHRVMREQGVRFNDVGTFARVNRYHRSAAARSPELVAQ